ncbi:MAG TPA: hypothetical protein VK837_14430 [Longimicrobiales bacterium]|nr:hypothetical protein [Longimicrobiales bacterium]
MIKRIVPLLLASLLGAACGDRDAARDPADSGDTAPAQAPGAQATGAPPRVGACDLLSSAEVAEAFGTTFEDGRLQEHGTGEGENYFSICIFEAANEAAQPSVSVAYRPDRTITDPDAALRASIEDMRQNAMPDFEFDPVPVLGAGAGWSPALMQLHVFRPGFMLSLGAMGDADPRDALTSLARTALERVPGGA